MYLGDFSSTADVPFAWDSYNSSGGSVAPGSSGVVSVFEATSTAAAVLGLTENRNYRGVTGSHQGIVNLPATGFFVPGRDYQIVLTGSSIDGQTVSGVLGQFSIKNRHMRGTDGAALAANVPANSSAIVIDSTGGQAVPSVTGAVGGRFLPANSSLLSISASGIVQADTVRFAGSSTAVTQVTANIDATISSRSTMASSDVNFQVVDGLSVDTYAEPSGAPPATTTLAGKIGYLYAALRGRIDVTSSDKRFYGDGGTVMWAKALSDTGSTYTEAKGA